MDDFKDKLTDFLSSLQNFFPKQRRHVSIAKIQLMPLLIWMPKRVAETVYKNLEPYIEFLEKKELMGTKLPPISIPGIPSINLHTMVGELDTEQKGILSKRIIDVFDEAGKALSKPTIKGGAFSEKKRKRNEPLPPQVAKKSRAHASGKAIKSV